MKLQIKTTKRDWLLYLRAAKMGRASSETVILVLLERLELNIPSIPFLLEVGQSQLELGKAELKSLDSASRLAKTWKESMSSITEIKVISRTSCSNQAARLSCQLCEKLLVASFGTRTVIGRLTAMRLHNFAQPFVFVHVLLHWARCVLQFVLQFRIAHVSFAEGSRR